MPILFVMNPRESGLATRHRGSRGPRMTAERSIGDGLADGRLAVRQVALGDPPDRAAVEAMLERSAEHYRAFVAHFPTGSVMLFDTDCRYVAAAGDALADAGQASAELQGRTVWEAHPEPMATSLAESYRAALAGDARRWEHVTGSGRAYESSAVPVRDRDGRVYAGAVLTVEITERVRQAAEQQALVAIATLVARGTQPEAVFHAVAAQAAALFDATLGGIVRFDGIDHAGRIVGSWSQAGADIADATVDLNGPSAAAIVYRTGEPVRLSGYSDRRSEGILEWFELDVAICAPIVVNGRLWGSAGVSFAGDRVVPSDAEQRLTRFAELAAGAIANADAWDRLTVEAATDALTGLANHRTLQARLRAELEQATRHHRPLSLAILDIDHFKAVNDSYGHQAGDVVLIDVARRMSAAVRSSEFVARVGGEEFVWLMPETGQEAAYAAAERLRKAIEATPFRRAGTVTISIGVCSNEHTHDAETLLGGADQALYNAKRTGRNRTCVAPNAVIS